ncbi:hypothetical protein [Streptomyces sp. NPDC016845]|uniref:hypothetical protein n=1 Tax=Streptomyces sp. NPDC016845 TaxID=3364972 RepID=UPI0037AAA5BA
MRRKTLLMCGAVVVVALLVGAAYAAGLPPFKEKGEIDAADLCPSLGNSSQSLTALKEVLPDRDSYSFEDNVSPLTESRAADFTSRCFVDGDSDQLLVAKTEMLEDDSGTSWATWVKGTVTHAQGTTPFEAGTKAFASGRLAAIYMPCTTKPVTNISVAVDLKVKGSASPAKSRTDLIVLAKNVAKFAHHKARCTSPGI